MADHVEVVLTTEPGDVPTWLPHLEQGGSLVLPTAPGAAAVLREAIAFGLVRTADPTNAAGVQAARAELEGLAVDPADRALVTHLVQARHRGSGDVPDTRPRILVVALDLADVDLVRRAERCAPALEPSLQVWASRTVARSGLLPDAAAVVDIGRGGELLLPPAVGSFLSETAPPFARRVARAVLRRAARLPGRRGSRDPGAPAVWDRRVAEASEAALAGWAGLSARLAPAVGALLVPSALIRELDVDVVVASAGAQPLMWRLLRVRPELEVRGSINAAAVHEVVRRRSRLAVGDRS